MMEFKDCPVIPATNVYREARVSPTRGNSVVGRLREQGLIETPPTPTKRTILTPAEAQRLYEALCS